jgi:hypothetical protein
MCPIIISLIKAFENFLLNFKAVQNNYLKSPLYGDSSLTVSPRSKEYFRLIDLDMVQSLPVRENLLKLRICDFIADNTVRTRHAMEIVCGGPIPIAVYDKLKKIVNTANTKFKKPDLITRGVDLTTFIGPWVKGSKKFRILKNEKYVSHNVMKFASNMETVIDINCSGSLNSDWTTSYYSNQLRTFIFKLHNNTLPYNTTLSHFVRGANRNCTFCDLEENPDPVDETPFHLFFDCPTAERIRLEFFKWLTQNNNFALSRHQFFCCGPSENKRGVWMAIIYSVKFYLWECKLRKTTVTIEALKKFVTKEIKLMTRLSKMFELMVNSCGLFRVMEMVQG